MAWTEDELRRIGDAQELDMARVRRQRRAARSYTHLGRARR